MIVLLKLLPGREGAGKAADPTIQSQVDSGLAKPELVLLMSLYSIPP